MGFAGPAGQRGRLPRAVKIVIVGAGQVGSTIVEALHSDHDLTAIDVVRERLEPLAYRYDVGTIEANGASRVRSGTQASATPTSSSRARRATRSTLSRAHSRASRPHGRRP